jgi:hypothetical protein
VAPQRTRGGGGLRRQKRDSERFKERSGDLTRGIVLVFRCFFNYLYLGRLVGVEPTTSAATERRSATEL